VDKWSLKYRTHRKLRNVCATHQKNPNSSVMKPTMRYLSLLITLHLAWVCITMAQVELPMGAPSPQPGATNGSTSGWLTPELLGMPRSEIAFDGPRLRLFDGYGAMSVRDRSVTGVQSLQFPPIDVENYKFYLAFREATTGVLIQDVVQDVYQHMVRTGRGPHPLGLNFTPGTPYVMLLQRAYWEPDGFYRTGTFHKQLKDHWISFGIATKASVSADSDEIYLRVQLHNREAAPLLLTVIPDQRAQQLQLSIPNVNTRPASAVTHPNAYTLQSNQVRVTVVSDLQEAGKTGWSWKIPGRSSRTADFAIILQQMPASPPALFSRDIAQRMAQAASAERQLLNWAAARLPRVRTADPAFDDLYRRSILSILESRWDRPNFAIRPFYAVGTWTSSVPWDTSYTSQTLSMLDPEGLRRAFLSYIDAGLMTRSYIPWNGKANTYWYAQNPFAELRILQDYMRQTGDVSFLNQVEKGATVFEWMKRMGKEVEKRYARPDGLLDFGAGSEKLLELRTDGYQHIVAADNGMAVAYFRQIAQWCRMRRDPEDQLFEHWANEIEIAMKQKLWDPKLGWFVNLYPDGSRHLVWSYHLFDLLDSGVLSAVQERGMVSHLREGEFLAPYGIYSISKADLVHWDLEDVDWGGGGQYTGEPFRLAESLYRLGYAETGWDILARCTRWTKHFPYIPQEIFGDFPGYPKVEMPVALASGSAVQAVLFGVFGLQPQMDGSLTVSPAYHHELGIARMSGYKFRDHTYDVVLGPWDYQVFEDGKLVARAVYGQPAVLPPRPEDPE
jgi:glycogen debranching enzyme